jgi:tRNA nucleotidyltransferase (CCA-adding enzyme)
MAAEMKIYLVGGAVRDQLLGLPPVEKDWVVVGSTPEEMLSLGFRPVGKDFPVFLHPETHEEYALARTERKTGRGYTQFVFHASPDVTLEEDLRRRDLTINAIAMSETGEIIDPYGGQKDIQAKILRHVSPAFVEDPVRILRAARLMARFGYLGFTIASGTYDLMSDMVNKGEVDALVPNRVWSEFDRALAETTPLLFFEVLYHCGALQKLFPEFVSYATFPSLLSCDLFAGYRFAILTLGLTQTEIKTFSKRYPVPVEYRELALTANKTQAYFYQQKLSPEDILNLLEKADAFRRDKRFAQLLEIFKDSPYLDIIQKAFNQTQKISAQDFIQQGHSGKILGEKIREKRLEVIKNLCFT